MTRSRIFLNVTEPSTLSFHQNFKKKFYFLLFFILRVTQNVYPNIDIAEVQNGIGGSVKIIWRFRFENEPFLVKNLKILDILFIKFEREIFEFN